MIAQRIIVFLGIVLSVLTAGLGSARADSVGKIETSYEVNVRGITVLDIKYTSESSASGYRSQASIETRGVAAIFSDYRMKMAASGALVDGRTSPAQYKSRSEKKEKTKAVEVNWSQGAVLASETVKNPVTKAELDAAVSAGVTDPLTAIFQIGASPSGRPCQAVHRIFDGKEVFELRFSFQGEAVLDESFPGAYHGKAFACRATYVPVAGRYATKFRKRNEEPPTYSVWLASIGEGVAGESRLIPVRATGRLDGMKFEAYASRVKIDGRPFKTVSASGN